MFCPKWTSFPSCPIRNKWKRFWLPDFAPMIENRKNIWISLTHSHKNHFWCSRKLAVFWFMCGIHWCDRIQPFSYFSGGCRSDVMKPVLFKRKIDVPTSTPKMRSSPNWPPQGLHKTENRFDNNEKHSTTSQHALEMLHNPPLGLKQLFWWLHKGIPL